ncbi:MAG: hypothetical protein ACE5FY_00875 [Nitrospiria bacterium]
MGMTFEKLSGPIYPAYLRVGDYSIALEPELIQSLQEHLHKEAAKFLEMLIEKVAVNRYLREMIQAEIGEGTDQEAIIGGLKVGLRAL